MSDDYGRDWSSDGPRVLYGDIMKEIATISDRIFGSKFYPPDHHAELTRQFESEVAQRRLEAQSLMDRHSTPKRK